MCLCVCGCLQQNWDACNFIASTGGEAEVARSGGHWGVVRVVSARCLRSPFLLPTPCWLGENAENAENEITQTVATATLATTTTTTTTINSQQQQHGTHFIIEKCFEI